MEVKLRPRETGKTLSADSLIIVSIKHGDLHETLMRLVCIFKSDMYSCAFNKAALLALSPAEPPVHSASDPEKVENRVEREDGEKEMTEGEEGSGEEIERKRAGQRKGNSGEERQT